MDKKKINVLHIDSEKTWRGGQQQVAYLLEGVHARGYKTALVCQPSSALEAYCKTNQLPYYPVKMKGEMDILSGYKIAALCKKEQYNILHLHSAHAIATGLWTKLFYRSLKLIGVRRVDFHIRKNMFSRFKHSTPMLNRLVCISKNIAQVAKQDNIPEEKLVTIHSGVDVHKYRDTIPAFDFKKRFRMPEDHIIVGTVAAIAGHKNYPNLLHAARTVINETDNVTFCAVGDGPDEKEVHKLAGELHLGDRFIFTGFQKDVGSFLKSFDIFVLASYKEGLGTSVLDAQAVGLPVIGCDAGGIPEMIENGMNGILVPSRDSEALAAAIMDLVRNKDKRDMLGHSAKQTVTRFSIEETVRKNIDLYQRILETE